MTSRQIELARAQADLARRSPLLADQAISSEEVKHATEAVAMARANLAQAQRQAEASRALVGGVPVRENPAVLVAKAAFRDAWISASRNEIVAPVTGYVALRNVQLGQRIQPISRKASCAICGSGNPPRCAATCTAAACFFTARSSA